MRTGLFGGTFDPIHIGHLIIAETLWSDFPLDRILFIPANIPPHKKNQSITTAQIRFKMIQLAVKDIPYMDVLDIELKNRGISYSIETIRSIKNSEDYCVDDLFMIIGGDSLSEFDTWKDPDKLLQEVQIIVISRPGFQYTETASVYKKSIITVDAPLIGISSSEIRNRVRLGNSIRYWVPDQVASYIQEKGLYTQ